MANVILNILESKNVQTLPIYSIWEDKYGKKTKYFDFEKITPMPKELRDPDVCKWESGIVAHELDELGRFISEHNPMNQPIPVIGDDLEQFLEKLYQQINQTYSSYLKHAESETDVEIFTSGKIPMQKKFIHLMCDLQENMRISMKRILRIALKRESNKEHFGYSYWYDWSNHHWGTKWNTMETMFHPSNPNLVSFLTAWNPPEEIFKNLLIKFPKQKFSLYYADNDVPGYHVGVLDAEYNSAKGAFEMVHRKEIGGTSRAKDRYHQYQIMRNFMEPA